MIRKYLSKEALKYKRTKARSYYAKTDKIPIAKDQISEKNYSKRANK